MNILILDDSAEKIGALTKLIQEKDENHQIVIDYSLDLSGGRSKLTKSYFDLLILDLNMPEQIGDVPSFRAGADFVDEIIDTNRIRKPTDIIILTAFDESVKVFKEKIEHAGFLVLQYNPTETTWRDSLSSRIEYLLCCRNQWMIKPCLPECDVAIITAVPVETASILSIGYTWETFALENDPSVYRRATIDSPKPISIVHVQLPEMGMPAAATIATKLILQFHPKYLIMPGIAAGIDDHLNYGDIIIATDIWNYSSGKYKEIMAADGSETVDLLPDSKHIPLDSTMRELLAGEDYTSLLEQIKGSFSEINTPTKLSISFGPIACGSAVVSSDKIIVDQILAHSRKTIGLDMESYGICIATQSTTSSSVIPLIIKSVSDKGDNSKSDEYQRYAAFTSAQFVKNLIERILFRQ